MAKVSAGRFFPVECATVHSFMASATRVVSKTSRSVGSMLVVVLAGRYRADGPEGQADRVVRAGAGDVVYWPAGMERIEQNSTDERLKEIALYFDWLSAPPALPRVIHDHHGMIRALAETLLGITDLPLPQRRAMRNAYLSAMIAEYVRLAAQLGEDLAARVVRYIQEHLSEPISLDDLAGHVGLEPHHFCRRYKALTGRTPMHDVRRVKAEHAARTLSNQGYGLKAVAAGLGLNDPLLLSKWLRKYVGVSVRNLRK